VRLVDREDLGLSGQRLTFAGPGLGPDGLTAFVKLLGRAGAANALAAVSAALAAGVVRSDVAAGLSAVEPSPGRLRPVVGRDGLRLIDDSYNANPTSMRAGLEFLGALVDVPGRGAILGDMLELGTEAARSHRLLGRLAAGVGLDFLALVGELSAETAAGAIEAGFDPKAAAVFDDPLSAAEWAAERAIPGAAVLIKASRSVGLDKATERLSSGEATSGVESP
jgi:UDP-N-acetylmuramoyl-tripeptide--D-alanyl-D-alanine ligase